MFKFDQWWLPDGEEHLTKWMTDVNRVVDGRKTYQRHKYDRLLEACRDRKVCVDVGAHVGLMSYWMAKDFEAVHAFEPVAAHRECFVKNVEAQNVFLHDCALGEKEGSVRIQTGKNSSGDSWIAGDGDIPLRRLDDFALHDVSCIKIDCEGSELFVLRGAEATVKRCRPAIMVEQKPGHAQRFGVGETDAVPLLKSWGATLVREISGDFIFAFK